MKTVLFILAGLVAAIISALLANQAALAILEGIAFVAILVGALLTRGRRARQGRAQPEIAPDTPL